ncbi:class I adenylate-forming enzyme family protein [Hydrogenophaga sp.]|uniref:class I adenylate-forming enzyme family protein n=1 Tax=Hydrogenophaga sp. TaxID=1904254 RepID=UPI00271D1202|nr:class I adenylate-forming enzyme family protein [Hydrogenophaga sp.]MDO9436360.1 class I adenylate-forming enzyme family protein [Hydrogenophaga sp.]
MTVPALPVPNLAEQLALHARQRPTHPAVVHGDVVLNFRDLDLAVRRRAAHLQDAGVTPGRVVGIALSDSIEHVVMLYAVARAGGVILPMDCRWRDVEKQRLAEHFEPALVVVEPGAAFQGAPCKAVDAAWLAAVERADPERDFPDGNRGIAMSLSSGTTGRPKGPMVTHQKFFNRFWTHWVDLGFGSRETYINATPLYFGGGRSFTMSTLYAGGTVVLCPPPYKPEELAAEIARTGSTVLFLVPTLLRRLLTCDAATLAPFRALKTLISSGSALTAPERTQIRETICPNFIEYYSSTEGGGVSVLSPRDQQLYGESVGRPIFGVEVQIVDDQDAPVPVGTVGRIRYRGPAVADGFYKDPEASLDAFRDGFFYPGDLGSFNEEGYLFLRGRSKDMIIRGGINIYPQEVESLLMSHAAVSEAAVVGWPSREFNEEVAAFVTLRKPVEGAELIALCRAELAPYKAPRQVFVLDELPRNSAGKVVKARLVEQLAQL